MGIMDSAKNTHSADTHSADTHPNSRSDAQKSVQKSPQKSSQKSQIEERPVSYTHLTLPTSDLV